MIEQLRKLRTKSIILIILALLALTWQFLNYLTIKKYIPFDDFTNTDLVLIVSGYLFFILLVIGIISLVFTAFRVSMKYHSEKKKESKAIKKESTLDKSSTQNPILPE